MRRDRGAAGERRTRGTGEAAMTGRAMAVGIVVALVVMVAEREAWAGAPTEQLRTQIDRAIKVLEDPEMAKESRMVERRTAIRRIANEIFDFTETTRRSLGTHWQVRTAQEQEGMQADRELTVKKASQTK